MSWVTLLLSNRTRIGFAILLAIVVILTLITCAGHDDRRRVEAAATAGRTAAAAEASQKGLEHVVKTRRAQEAARHDPDLRRAECLRDSRTPQYCPSGAGE